MNKLYVWVMPQLSARYAGIQLTHVAMEIVLEMRDSNIVPELREEFVKWINSGHTVVLLKGGTVEFQRELLSLMDDIPDDDQFPWNWFQESDMDNLPTAIGIILNEDFAEQNRAKLQEEGNEWERKLLLYLSRPALGD